MRIDRNIYIYKYIIVAVCAHDLKRFRPVSGILYTQ